MQDFKLEVAKILSQQINEMTLEEIMESIEIPPNKEMGDYAFPCFKLAKVYRKSPTMIAQDICNKTQRTEYISNIEVAGGYVNFFVDKTILARNVINDVLSKKDKYGHSNIGQGKTTIVEFSSPNIAKPFHIGHVRTTVIGNSLYKIYESQGYNTIRINHLGDYGTQFGKLIVAFKKWGNEDEVKESPISALLKLYVQFHEEVEKDASLDDEARLWFKKLEDEDEEAVKLWKWFRDESLKEFSRVYDMLDIEFDSYAGESFYSDKMPRVIDLMNEKGIMKESRGA